MVKELTEKELFELEAKAKGFEEEGVDL